jgi:hypothetical protein
MKQRRKQKMQPSKVKARKKALGKGLLQAARDVKKREGVVPDWLHERMKEK